METESEKEVLKETKKGLKERRAYIVLVAISIFLSMAVFVLGHQAIHDSNHKFCDLFNALLVHPAPKPADPKKDPSRERSYLIYQKFKLLDHNLGCD